MTTQPTGRTGTSGNAGRREHGRMAEAGPRPASGQRRSVVLPLILLIILGMAGLRGAVTTPQWNGAQRHDGLVVGLAFEAILAVLLLIAIRRRFLAERAEPGAAVSDVAPRLRAALIFVLVAGMIAVAVAILLGLHLQLGVQPPGQASVQSSPSATPTGKLTPGPPATSFHFHVPPLSDVLYGVLIAMLAAGSGLSVWWSQKRRRPSRWRRRVGLFAEDPEDLREAVESGRWALHTVDDTRAAIIACYVAMENSLAERGAARGIADTPDELLARATESGLVRGTAAARLTALFYEARFSSHPMDRGQRDAAERALDDLAAAVAGPAKTEASP